MLRGRIENQKGTRKILVDLLYKKAYCLCIPDSKFVKSCLEQVSSSWMQNFFLSKNELKLAVIPMFMLIFVKNKRLTIDQSQRLLELLHLLIMQAEFDTIDQLFFDNKIQQLAWPYYFLNELIKFTRVDFLKSEENSKRIMLMAKVIELLIEKASQLTLSKFCLNIENSGFNVIQKLLCTIAYEDLHSAQIIYLNNISQKLISKTTEFGIETISFQTYHNGYSFIWYALGTWLQLVFAPDNFNQIKINVYTELMNRLFEKIDNEKISFILLENKNKGYSIILRYIFFSRLQLSVFQHDLRETFNYFNSWCKIFFSALTFNQIKLILKTLPLILSNDSPLSIADKRQLLEVFFGYLFDYSKLKTQELVALKDLKERLEADFFPSNGIMKFFRQVRAHWHFFNASNSRNSINKTDQISPDESCDLLTSECARLNSNYLTVSM